MPLPWLWPKFGTGLKWLDGHEASSFSSEWALSRGGKPDLPPCCECGDTSFWRKPWCKLWMLIILRAASFSMYFLDCDRLARVLLQLLRFDWLLYLSRLCLHDLVDLAWLTWLTASSALLCSFLRFRPWNRLLAPKLRAHSSCSRRFSFFSLWIYFCMPFTSSPRCRRCISDFSS